ISTAAQRVGKHVVLIDRAARYEWSEGPWSRIQDLRPGRKESGGRTAAAHWVFVYGGLWVLRSGARWCDWPERSGQYKTVHKRWARGAVSGVWDALFRTLSRAAKNEY